MTEEDDRCLDEETFSNIVTELMHTFCRLEWMWLGGQGTLGEEVVTYFA